MLICEPDLYQTPPCPVNILYAVTSPERCVCRHAQLCRDTHSFRSQVLLTVTMVMKKDIKKINGGANYSNTLDFIVVNLVGVYIYKWYLYLLKEYVQYYMYKSRECVCILPCTVVYQVTDSAIYLGPFLCEKKGYVAADRTLCTRDDK